MKFLKENKIAVISIAAIVLTFLLMFIPGFARFAWIGDHFKHLSNGYEFIFNTTIKSSIGDTKFGTGFVNAGIAAIVLLGLALVSYCFSKKSSFFLLLGGLLTLVNSILFFSMEASAAKVYAPIDEHTTCGWVTYFIGAILLLAAAYALNNAIKIMKDEIKHPSQSKGPSYNYLKK